MERSWVSRGIFVEKDDAERLYVVETTSCLFAEDLRDKESARIACGKAQFGASKLVEAPAEHVVARAVTDVVAVS